MDDDELEMKVDVLVAEYQAAHINRNHYEGIRWTIASILMAASFTLMGISFIQEIKDSTIEVVLLACVSLALMMVWFAIHTYVSPFVRLSLERLWEIEKELQSLGFDAPKLHTTIRKETEFQKGRGLMIRYGFVILAYFAWLFRILILVLTLAL
jgi:hypothetical protein